MVFHSKAEESVNFASPENKQVVSRTKKRKCVIAEILANVLNIESSFQARVDVNVNCFLIRKYTII